MLLASAASAQVDDPLYPLGVGDVWEYEVDLFYMMSGSTTPQYRERREVLGDTTIGGQAYRVVRVQRAAGDAAGWSPHGRCAVRVDRAPAVPAIEWVAITGSCAPREQGLALGNVSTGQFSVTVLGDVVAFTRRVVATAPDRTLVEGLGFFYSRVVTPSTAWEMTKTTYARVGRLQVGRAYTPGWWHDLVRLETGDQYQYRRYVYGIGRPATTTYEAWTVRGDTVVAGATYTLVQQVGLTGAGAQTRQSFCGVSKGVSSVSTVTLQGPACTGITVDQIWWFSNLKNVQAFGGTHPGSSTVLGYQGAPTYRSVTFAQDIGYLHFIETSNPGTMGSASGDLFELRYAVVGGVAYGSLGVVAGEPAPAAGHGLSVHPNPFATELHVTLDAAHPAPAALSVLDALGRRVFAARLPGPGRHPVALPELPPGVYHVRAVFDDGTVLTRRVTRAR